MAITIPTAPRATAPRTRPLDLPEQAQTNPDANGAGLAEGLGRASQALQRDILAPEWEQANAAKVDGAAEALARRRIELGDQLAQAKGEQAIKLSGELERTFQADIDKQRQGLVNDAQRTSFERHARQSSLAFQAEVGNHVVREADAVAVARNDALVLTQQNLAIRNRGDEAQSWTDQMNAETARANFLRKRGVPAEAVKAELDQIRSRYVAQVIQAHADDQNDKAAQRWLDVYGADLSPQDKHVAERITKDATTKGQAMRQVDEFLKVPDRTVTDVMAEAQKIDDPTQRAAFEARAIGLLSLQRQAKKEQQDQAFEQAYAIAKDNPRGIDAVPLSQLQAMGPEQRQRLEAWAVRQTTGAALPWQQSKAKRYQIMEALSNPTEREQVIKAGPAGYLGTMNEDDQNAVATAIEKARNGGEPADFLTTSADLVNESLAAMQINPKLYTIKDGKAEPNEVAINWRDAIQREAVTIAAANKRTEPTTADVRAAISAVTARKAFVNEWGTDPELPAAAMTADQRAKAYVPIDRIPPGRVQAIRDLFATGGGKATDDRIQRAYAAYLAGDRDRLNAIILER